MVSPRHSGRLLGYERTPKEGPWLIRQLVTAYHRGVRYVPWEWVEGYDVHSARIDRPATELPELGDLPVR